MSFADKFTIPLSTPAWVSGIANPDWLTEEDGLKKGTLMSDHLDECCRCEAVLAEEGGPLLPLCGISKNSNRPMTNHSSRAANGTPVARA